MKKDIPLILFIGFFFWAFVILSLNPPKIHIETKKVRIDSVKVEDRYSMMPSKVWTAYTKFGPIFTKEEKYHVGDSTEIKISTFKKQ